MASVLQRESSFCNKDLCDTIINILYIQKQEAIFCDVVMKVCDYEIFAHSNILAAASPYFSNFLGQDLPRQFSQRAPQVIEIQIDGNEPNHLYAEAVGAMIDYIYTGKMSVTQVNVFQISEIARIMQMDSVIQFCDHFSASSLVGDTVTDTGAVSGGGGPELWEVLQSQMGYTKSTIDVAVNTDGYICNRIDMPKVRVKAKKLLSVSTQVLPQLLGLEIAKEKICVSTQVSPGDDRLCKLKVKQETHKDIFRKFTPTKPKAVPGRKRGRPRLHRIPSTETMTTCGMEPADDPPLLTTAENVDNFPKNVAIKMETLTVTPRRSGRTPKPTEKVRDKLDASGVDRVDVQTADQLTTDETEEAEPAEEAEPSEEAEPVAAADVDSDDDDTEYGAVSAEITHHFVSDQLQIVLICNDKLPIHTYTFILYYSTTTTVYYL